PGRPRGSVQQALRRALAQEEVTGRPVTSPKSAVPSGPPFLIQVSLIPIRFELEPSGYPCAARIACVADAVEDRHVGEIMVGIETETGDVDAVRIRVRPTLVERVGAAARAEVMLRHVRVELVAG